MRDLTLDERISKYELEFFEKDLAVNLPNDFKSFMQRYGGLRVKENQYHWCKDGKEMILYISEFLNFTEMFDLSTKIKEAHKVNMIPFANDPNGMYFFLSCEENGTFGVNILSVDLSSDFIEVDDSFSNFINNLQ